MLPDLVKAIRRSRLPDPVGERLGVVRPVTEAGGLVPEGDAVHVEQGGVGVSEGVPSHPGAVQTFHGVDQCLACAAIVAADREGEVVKDLSSPCGEWYHANALARLRRVDPSVSVLGAADASHPVPDVLRAQGYDLTPPQAGEQDELGDAAPDSGEAVDDRLDLGKCELVVASSGRRDAWTVQWQGQGADDAPALGVAQGAGEGGVDPLHGGRGLAGGEQRSGELGQVLGADLAHEDRAEECLDVLDAPPVAGEGVGSGTGLADLGGYPEVECCGKCFLWDLSGAEECALGCRAAWADWRVRVTAADLSADEPLAAALLPFGALVTASLDKGGDR